MRDMVLCNQVWSEQAQSVGRLNRQWLRIAGDARVVLQRKVVERRASRWLPLLLLHPAPMLAPVPSCPKEVH